MKLNVMNRSNNQRVLSTDGNLADILKFLNENRPFVDHPAIWSIVINDRFTILSINAGPDGRLTATNVHVTDNGAGPMTLAQAITSHETQVPKMFDDAIVQRLMGKLADIEKKFARLDESCHQTIQSFRSRPIINNVANITKLQRDVLLIEALRASLFTEVTSQTTNPGVLLAAQDLEHHIMCGYSAYNATLRSFISEYSNTIAELTNQAGSVAADDDCDGDCEECVDRYNCDGNCEECVARYSCPDSDADDDDEDDDDGEDAPDCSACPAHHFRPVPDEAKAANGHRDSKPGFPGFFIEP